MRMEVEFDEKEISRRLHREGGGMFYRGVRGRSCGRGGLFPASSDSALTALSPLILDFGQGQRLLLENRKDQYEEVFEAEMRAVDRGGLEQITPGLWKSARPLNPDQLGQLASLRGEAVPLLGPYANWHDFLRAIQALPELPVPGWSLYHVRLEKLATGSPHSMEMALATAQAMTTKPAGGRGGAVLVLLETRLSLYLCVSTLGRSTAVLLTPQTFKERPFNFPAALDPMLAAVALNVLGTRLSCIWTVSQYSERMLCARSDVVSPCA